MGNTVLASYAADGNKSEPLGLQQMLRHLIGQLVQLAKVFSEAFDLLCLHTEDRGARRRQSLICKERIAPFATLSSNKADQSRSTWKPLAIFDVHLLLLRSLS